MNSQGTGKGSAKALRCERACLDQGIERENARDEAGDRQGPVRKS